MLTETGIAEHFACVATNWNGNTCLKIMMIVKSEPVWELWNTTFVIGDMTKVFAYIFEIAFETTHGHRIKVNHACFALDVLVVKSQLVFGDHSIIKNTCFC